ncbi:MAG: Xaa-Pro peptidase family protein [Bryobacteraceae bacterium]
MTESEKRRLALNARLSEHKIDALLVTHGPNVRYLTGFTGSNGLLLIRPDAAVFFTDPRYTIQASEEVDCKVEIVKKGPLVEAAASLAKRWKIKRLGFGSGHVTVDAYEKLKSSLPLGVTLRPASGLVEALRLIKSNDEVDAIRRAVEANSKAFQHTVPLIRPGPRESDVAAELEFQMRRNGAEKPAFETIVAAGVRSALPHALPTSHRLANNELLLIDMGATLDGYTSDMTRVAYLGTAPQKVKRMYRAVLEAQKAAISIIKEGVTAGQVDKAARDVLKKHGLDKSFVHSTGHGLGLEIHEAPRIAAGEKTKLEAGMVITIEPGAYEEGFGGIRIEDTVLVTRYSREVLTPTPRELINL